MPALAAFAMYPWSMSKKRFIGAFLVLLFVGLSARASGRVAGGAPISDVREIIIVAMFCLTVGLSSARAAYARAECVEGQSPTRTGWWRKN